MFVVIIPIEQFKTINKLSYENTFFFFFVPNKKPNFVNSYTNSGIMSK